MAHIERLPSGSYRVKVSAAGEQAFATCTSDGESVLVLDWQHTCFRVRPDLAAHARCPHGFRTVISETCYLIDRTLGPTAEAAFLHSVGTGPDCTIQMVELVGSDLRRMSGLVRQYADLRLGGTDASVVAILLTPAKRANQAPASRGFVA